MSEDTRSHEEELADARVQARRYLRSIPLWIAGALAFALLVHLLAPLRLKPLLLGAAGWWVALILRAPVAAVAKRLTDETEKLKLIVASSSGPLEEGTRLVVCTLVVIDVSSAVSVGLGWALIEWLFTIVQGVVQVRLLQRDDETGARVRQMLESQLGAAQVSPLWGLFERFSASFAHMGFTLLVAARAWLALPAAVAHTALNLTALWLAPKSVAKTEAFVFVFGVSTLVAGVVAYLG
jgi:hypothetical protein